jgi:hypothetical protein
MSVGRRSSNSDQHALLPGLYQVAEAQEPQFAAGHDLEAGLAGYQTGLHEQGQGTSRTPAQAAR